MPNTRNQPQGDLLTAEKNRIRYGKCIGCPDLGPRCGAGNLLNLPIDELRAWIRLWRMFWGLSIEQCAAIWDTPFGTTARVLSEADSDFKYSTMHHIVYRIVNYGIPSGQELSDNPCPATSSEISAQLDSWKVLVSQKEQECEELRKRITEKDEQMINELAEQRRASDSELQTSRRSIEFLLNLSEKRQADIDEKNRVMNLRRVEVAALNDTISALQSQRVDDMREADARNDALREEYRVYRRRSRTTIWIIFAVAIVLGIGFLCYLIWDALHPAAGLFWY